MTAVAILARARADGLSVRLDPPDTIVLRGDPIARARLLPDVRQHKSALVRLLSGSDAESDTAPIRCWLIQLPTGERFSSSFCPPATMTGVRRFYPGAAIEPDPGACLEVTE